jgi:4-amino-4-deoxy-L-arabinose transferase-like glycosyltransferase
MTTERKYSFPLIAICLLLGGLSFLPGLDLGMLDPTDSFFVEAAREMLEKQHFSTPLINYQDWFDKPALPFWLIITCYKAFGVSAWAARLPSALSGILLAIATACTVNRILNKETAFTAAFVLLTSPLFLIVGHTALTDEPLSLFIGAGLLWIAEALILSDRRSLWSGSVALGLAVLCKGPIGLILAGGTLCAFTFISCLHDSDRRARFLSIRQRLKPLEAALLVALVSLPYYVLVHFQTNGAFTSAFFLQQNVGRLEGAVNHREPFWFYVPVMLGGYFPWSLAILAAIPWLCKSYFARVWTRRQELLWFAVSWSIVVLVLFNLIPTKLPTYIVPASPALAIIAAIFLQTQIKAKRTVLLRFFGICTVLAAAIIGLLPLFYHPAAVFENPLVFLGIVIMTAGIVQLYLVHRKSLKLALLAQLCSVFVATACLVPLGFSLFFLSNQVDINYLVAYAQSKNVNLGTLFNRTPSVMFALDRPISELNSMDDIKAFARSPNGPHWILATKNSFQLSELEAARNLVMNKGKWYLISVDHLSK